MKEFKYNGQNIGEYIIGQNVRIDAKHFTSFI